MKKQSKYKRPIFYALTLALWLASMMYMHAYIKHKRMITATGKKLAIFQEAFEGNLQTNIKLSMFGKDVGTGQFTRRTSEPFAGRKVVREYGYGSGNLRGNSIKFRYWGETRWDSESGGFVNSKTTVLLKTPLSGETIVKLRASRENVNGETVILVQGQMDGAVIKSTKIPLKEGVDLSSDFLAPAPVADLRIGSEWSEKQINPMTGEVVESRTKIIADDSKDNVPEYRAVQTVTKETGQTSELSICWYDVNGKPLRQQMSFGGLFTINIFDIRRLSPSKEQYDLLVPPAKLQDEEDKSVENSNKEKSNE